MLQKWKKIVDFFILFFREINLVRKKHTSLALFHSTAPLESIFSSKFLLVNRKCTHVKKILPHFCHFIAFTNYTFLANFREQCIGPGCCLLYRDPNTTVLYLLSQCQVHLSISIFTYLRFWNDPDGSMKAEINVFWIFPPPTKRPPKRGLRSDHGVWISPNG